MARSRSVAGPYEPDPAGPLLSSWTRPDLTLQKAGHGSLVETPAGQWYLAHLVGRPLTERGRCMLGRETAIQAVTWTDDGWPRIDGGVPHDAVPAPDLPAHPWPPEPVRDDFDAPALGPRWSTLRRPAAPDWLSLTERPGHLRLYGGQSPLSRFRASLVGRRLQHRRATFAASVDFAPTVFQQLAGITAYYNTRNYYYLHVTADDEGNRVLRLLGCDRGVLSYLGDPVPLPPGAVALESTVDNERLGFRYRPAGGDWHSWPGEYDASTLSDEYATESYEGVTTVWGFTGAFFGLWAQDLTGGRCHADIDWADYRGTD